MSRRWLQASIVVVLVAVIFIIMRAQRRSSEQAAWETLANARTSDSPVTALEAARDSAQGTSAEPFAAFYLALELEAQGLDGLARASEVARAAADAHPDHVLAPMLQSLVLKLDGYRAGA